MMIQSVWKNLTGLQEAKFLTNYQLYCVETIHLSYFGLYSKVVFYDNW